jgi:hypothetical protein
MNIQTIDGERPWVLRGRTVEAALTLRGTFRRWTRAIRDCWLGVGQPNTLAPAAMPWLLQALVVLAARRRGGVMRGAAVRGSQRGAF